MTNGWQTNRTPASANKPIQNVTPKIKTSLTMSKADRPQEEYNR